MGKPPQWVEDLLTDYQASDKEKSTAEIIHGHIKRSKKTWKILRMMLRALATLTCQIWKLLMNVLA